MSFQRPRSIRRTLPLPRWRRRVERLGRAAGFWLAVALPLVYLPLLTVAPGLLADPAALGGLVGANLLAIVLGQGHDPTIGRRPRR